MEQSRVETGGCAKPVLGLCSVYSMVMMMRKIDLKKNHFSLADTNK